MEIVYRKLSELKPNPKNPRKGTKEAIAKLAESIKGNPKFFEARPILLSDRTGQLVIIGGERRSEAAALLKMETVPTILMSGLTEAQEDEILIKDNTHAGVWDEQKLQAWGKEQLQGWNVDGVKWPKQETEIKDDNFNPDKKVKSRVKPGELWQLGKHRLMCGDSTKAEDVQKLTGGAKIDMCFTSPPYNAKENLGGNTHLRDSRYIHKDDDVLYYQLLMESTAQMVGKCAYTFVNLQMLANNKRDVINWIKEYSQNFCDVVIWDKGNAAPAMAKNVLNAQFEFIFILSQKENATRAINLKEFRGTLSNVYSAPPQRNNEFAETHGATFPIHFPSWFISNFCPDNGTVIDCFCGTGTTIIAAEQLGRKSFGMEIEPHYCDVIISRWEQFTGKKAKKIK